MAGAGEARSVGLAPEQGEGGAAATPNPWVFKPIGPRPLVTLAVALHRGAAAVCQVPTSLAGLLSLLAVLHATIVSA